jgi:methionyl-tRNA formyltransferase
VGTDAFAVPSLRALHRAGARIPLVVTQPDRPAGRRLRLTAPPVKAAAEELGLEVFQPERIGSPESVGRLREVAPTLMALAAYGQIVPASVLELPARGIVNVHASLLPRWRGAAPIAHAILSGDRLTGVTIMQMDEQLDNGPILAARETEIGAHEDAASLAGRLAELGADLLVETLVRLDQVVPREQDHDRATYARKLAREDGELDWTLEAEAIDRRVRAFQPWPGVTLPWGGGRLKVLRGRARPAGGQPGERPPGEVLRSGTGGVEVACGVGSYVLEEVQVPNRRAMPARLLAAAHA